MTSVHSMPVLVPLVGNAGVAAVQLGRQFIGIEREPAYFEVMLRRIEEAHRQADLFIAAPSTAPTQTDIFEGAA